VPSIRFACGVADLRYIKSKWPAEFMALSWTAKRVRQFPQRCMICGKIRSRYACEERLQEHLVHVCPA